ncbi:sensor histidine kinase [Salinarchaeum laminariae]|uniref:sensor histidine kinase n=1 Tax=Salinarchaeum laminariae TaxID=869888 RepID=UPI0020BDE3A8|nr:PAS domain-containing sensor histidine kinase [Salinarchaeum laminariae]
MAIPCDVTLPPSFDSLDTGVTLHDPESGATLDVNDRLEQLYGYPANDLREMDVGEYSAPDAGYTHLVAKERIRAAATGETPTFEWRVERANGELLWVRVRLTATTIDGWECVLAEVRDITEYKARERRLRLLNRVIRHNLRNETNVLMGYADRLRSAIESETLLEEVDTITEVAHDIGQLSDSVQQIEQIADPGATERSPTAVGELVETYVTEAREQYPAASVSIDVREDCWVNADVGLEYALEHAIQNAIEHNDTDRPSVTVSIGKGSESGRVFVGIADDGPPIPEIEVDALDSDTSTTSTAHGTGLGLWVMQWCVDALGGQLSFEENHPRGNVVRFSLPAGEPPGDRES